MDVQGSWQLVRDIKNSCGQSAAASFKHTSPAGAAMAEKLSEVESIAFEVQGKPLTPIARAFIRARNGDPKSSYGDFIALSDEVDKVTAQLIAREFSDGIIAPSYTPEALEILKQKKDGRYVILQIDPSYKNDQSIEFRELFGCAFSQEPDKALTDKSWFEKIPTKRKKLSPDALRDLILANIILKRTQSNSVAFVKGGQAIGIGAGQQSRVDCVKIAGEKSNIWRLRFHDKVMELKKLFKKGVRRSDRNNAIRDYIEGNPLDESLFQKVPEPLSVTEKQEYLKKEHGVRAASDAFFPFRDNIDLCKDYGVTEIVQPGGSNRDKEVEVACNEHGILMAYTGTRVFTH